MSLSLRLRARTALIFCAVCTCVTHAESSASSALRPAQKLKINGVAVGAAPFEQDYPGGYFHKTKTAVGSRLGHPLVARLSFAGHSIKEIVLTEGPAEWISLKGSIGSSKRTIST
jgi:hypothetical protein